jgi:predicted DNA-binding protein (MmcQ/YjbR family)
VAKLKTLKRVTALLGAKPGASSSYPFGPGALVFKVGGKMFALLGDDETPLTMNLKATLMKPSRYAQLTSPSRLDIT